MLKVTASWIAAAIALPLTLLYRVGRFGFGDEWFAAYSQFLGLFPGKTGSYLRIGFYRFVLTKCARDCFIGFMTIFSQTDTEIDKGVYLGPACNIGSCKIGRNTLLGSGVHVMSGKKQHHFSDPSKPIKNQGGELTKVEIGKDCWIGNGALIMANLGDKCIVGAGAVVTDDFPAGSIVAGNPAKIVRQRDI